jgi:hypothetical protein
LFRNYEIDFPCKNYFAVALLMGFILVEMWCVEAGGRLGVLVLLRSVQQLSVTVHQVHEHGTVPQHL